HEPYTLIRMIVRMMVQKLNVQHAAILLHDKEKDTYILTVSRGIKGLKVPKGFARMDTDNPLIYFFRRHLNKDMLNNGALTVEQIRKTLKSKKVSSEDKRVLKGILYQMDIFETVACIPSYFRNELMGLLLLGSKKNNRKFAKEELDFFTALASDVAMALRNAQLFQDLESELQRNKHLFLHTTMALAAAIEANDPYTHGHTARVTDLSMEIAKQMAKDNKIELKENFLEQLQIAALLHDIGKIGIPEAILNKQDYLNDEERKRMCEHPLIGVNILSPIKELEDAILGVKYHHEKYDGSGYPEGLRAEQIPLIAAIISIADTFDAMTTDRPYRKAMTKAMAVSEIRKMSGTQFDPKLVKAFTELYEEERL
ncbi:MAG: HD domain-containing protein, partial [Candidatus Omnitrophica bacterium]|nr:HD domain-containing protein [Candidatus Omnitrophota bacterium]